jgi:hypothetical protein
MANVEQREGEPILEAPAEQGLSPAERAALKLKSATAEEREEIEGDLNLDAKATREKLVAEQAERHQLVEQLQREDELESKFVTRFYQTLFLLQKQNDPLIAEKTPAQQYSTVFEQVYTNLFEQGEKLLPDQKDYVGSFLLKFYGEILDKAGLDQEKLEKLAAQAAALLESPEMRKEIAEDKERILTSKAKGLAFGRAPLSNRKDFTKVELGKVEATATPFEEAEGEGTVVGTEPSMFKLGDLEAASREQTEQKIGSDLDRAFKEFAPNEPQKDAMTATGTEKRRLDVKKQAAEAMKKYGIRKRISDQQPPNDPSS